MLNGSNLDLQQGLFKITMKANAALAYGPPLDVNSVIKLWQRLSRSHHLYKHIPEYFWLAEIGYCLVFGNVEDERCFSSILGKHLPPVIQMFGQKYFALENFLYKEAINSWQAVVKVGRQGDV